MLTNDKLNSYLHKVDIRAKEQYDLLVKQLAESQGVTEQLKAENQMLWVQMMNSISNQTREMIFHNIIYVI
ncbi:MAG: TnpV protein [Acetobacter sp.]|nr:TnpV protein [Bacteroides sp.]MCM1340986.1 TnpV protein [Acetobacter sp.]MCM1432458.1 TnpV protein [Clostridiales bacterium]